MELCEKLVIEIRRKNLGNEFGWGTFTTDLVSIRSDLKTVDGKNLGEEMLKYSGIDENFYEHSCLEMFVAEAKEVTLIVRKKCPVC